MAHSRLWRALLAATTLLVALLPLRALANGNHAHSFISLHALAHLPEGPLRTFLTDPALRKALLNGTVFPDGGYAIGNGYGETAHWEPYQRELLAHIQAKHPQLENDPAAREKLAFVFGMFSHGMADQTYDALFMDAARVYDQKGWKDELLTSFDTATDVFWCHNHGPSPIPDLWLPIDDIIAVFAARGEPVDKDIVENGQLLLNTVVLGYPKGTALDEAKVSELKAMYPWGYENLTDPHKPGSPLCEGKVVAAYWQSIWAEIHGGKPELRILASIPTAGASHPFVTQADPEAKIAVIVSRGLSAKDLPSDALFLRDQSGALVDTQQNLFYGNASHVLRLLPKADWPVGQTMSMHLKAGVLSYDGIALANEVTVTFQFGSSNLKEPGLPPPESPFQILMPEKPIDGAATDADAVEGSDASGTTDAASTDAAQSALDAGTTSTGKTSKDGCSAGRTAPVAAPLAFLLLTWSGIVWWRRKTP